MSKYGLQLEQKNKLAITPQMYQAIEIMQLTLPELINYINNEVMENPLIEVEEHAEPSKEEKEQYGEQWLDKIVNGIVHEDYESWPQGLGYDKDIRVFEGVWNDNESLQEYLLEQLHFINPGAGITETVYKMAEYIIGNLDDNGYCVPDMNEIAQTFNSTSADVLDALQVVQQFDPPGIGARSLKECLRLQFHLIPDCPDYLEGILDYLDDLAAGHHKKIATALNITAEQVRLAGKLLRLLDPKPGSRFQGNNDIRYILPDAVIVKMGDEYSVIVNDYDIPKLCIQENYRKALQQYNDEAIRQFVREKISSGLNLIKNIELRRNTIHVVLTAIINRQKNFLEQGVSALKPLTMKEIAEEIGMHESTVSRICSNKYIQTPRGLMSIKSFFAGSIGREKEITPERIKEEIKAIITQENAQKPYSDQDLVSLLGQKGMDIARRTVAKYREELGIQSSSVRKIKI